MQQVEKRQSIHRQHLLKIMDKQRQKQIGLQVHVVDHCNLNCIHCSHFSPLAPERFLDMEMFENDCKRLNALLVSGGKIDLLFILGGEPLLHPRLPEIFDIARKYMSRTNIVLVTNGILLPKQNELFWKSCQRNRIVVSIGNYPIRLEYDTITSLAKKYSVLLNRSLNGENGWFKSPLDVQGKQNEIEAHEYCTLTKCMSLDNGRIYPCPKIAYIQDFNNYFAQNLEVSQEDWIDIYKAESINEIVDFSYKPKPFCRYCNTKENVYNVKWKVSKRELSEWV